MINGLMTVCCLKKIHLLMDVLIDRLIKLTFLLIDGWIGGFSNKGIGFPFCFRFPFSFPIFQFQLNLQNLFHHGSESVNFLTNFAVPKLAAGSSSFRRIHVTSNRMTCVNGPVRNALFSHHCSVESMSHFVSR